MDDDAEAFAAFYVAYALDCIAANVKPLTPDDLRALLATFAG